MKAASPFPPAVAGLDAPRAARPRVLPGAAQFSSRRKGRRRAWVVVCLVALLGLFFSWSFARDLNHDEHQFIAPAVLFLHAGLLPYRDYACFHTPDLIFIFAALFTTTNHYLLAARAFNAGCAALLLLLVFNFSIRRFRTVTEQNWSVGLALVLILSLNPFFRFTAGRAWNHDLAVLGLVAAFLAFLRAEKSERPWWWLALCGAAVGLAAGTRLSFAPMVAPFVLAIFFFPVEGQKRIVSLACFGGAVALALLPVGVLCSLAPRQFFFDNFTYNSTVNLLYRAATVPREIAFWNKLSFPFQYFLRSPATVLLLAGFFWFALRPWWRKSWRDDRELSVLLLLLPFVFLGSWAPTPSYRQYYYPFVPFLLLGNIIGLARIRPLPARNIRLLWLTVIVSLIEAIPSLPSSLGRLAPSTWPVFSVHAQAAALSTLQPRGRVLTLAPIFPSKRGSRFTRSLRPVPSRGGRLPFWRRRSARSLASSRRPISNRISPPNRRARFSPALNTRKWKTRWSVMPRAIATSRIRCRRAACSGYREIISG